MADMHVQDWMSAEPITVDETNTLSTAFQLMRINNVRRLPVLNRDDELVGILTWGDVREGRPKKSKDMTLQQIWESRTLSAICDVREFMSVNPVVISPTASIRTAVELMLQHKIGGLPVVDDDDQVVGVITESDAFRCLLSMLPKEAALEHEPTNGRRLEHV